MLDNKKYYLCSAQVVEHFTEFPKSKPFKSGYKFNKDKDLYIVEIPDEMWGAVEEWHALECEGKEHDFWARPIIDSNLSLTYEDWLSDEEDESFSTLTLKDVESLGLFPACEQYLGISKENNVAFAIYKLCEEYEVGTPIDFANVYLAKD